MPREIRAEVPSADSVDVLVAFIRWSGIRGLLDTLRHHREAGNRSGSLQPPIRTALERFLQIDTDRGA